MPMNLNLYRGVDIQHPESGETVLSIQHYFDHDPEDPKAFDILLRDAKGVEFLIPIQVLDEAIHVLENIRAQYSDQEMEFLRNEP